MIPDPSERTIRLTVKLVGGSWSLLDGYRRLRTSPSATSSACGRGRPAGINDGTNGFIGRCDPRRRTLPHPPGPTADSRERRSPNSWKLEYDSHMTTPRTEKHELARNTLPADLKPVFDDLVADYRFAATKHHRSPFVSYSVLADLVKAGWRLAADPLRVGTKESGEP